MANLQVDGLAELINDFDAIASLPDSVSDGILNAEADVIVTAQKKAMAQMWNGPYATGETARSVKKSKIKKVKGGKSISITPEGTNRRGESNATVAFINEYGKRGQPARPAIRTANEQAADAATTAGAKVYDDYLKSKNL